MSRKTLTEILETEIPVIEGKKSIFGEPAIRHCYVRRE